MADISIIVATNAKEVSNEIGGMANSLLASERKAKQLAKAFKFLDSSFNSGKIDAIKYSKAVQDLNKEEAKLYSNLGKTTSALEKQSFALSRSAGQASKASIAAKKLADSQRMAGKSTNKFGMYTQQVGYQVGDFFVQVQSGTDALVAFGQQGTQLAGLLPGLSGAVLGIGIALGTAIGRGILEAKNLTISFKKMGKDLKSALGPATPFINAIADAFSFVGRAAYKTFTLLINNLDAVIAYSAAFATILAGKLVYGFIASGRAATLFFAIVRAGMIATGVGALVVALGTLYLGFMRLVSGAGGFGNAMKLLKDVGIEVLDRISLSFSYLPLAMLSAASKMAANFMDSLRAMVSDFSVFTWTVAEGLNNLFGTSLQGVDTSKLNQTLYDSANLFDSMSISAGKAASAISSKMLAPLKSVKALVDAMDKAKNNANIDPADWLVADTKDKDKKGKDAGESKLAELLEEQRQRAELLKLSGKERLLKEEIFKITKALGDEAKLLSSKQIEALAKVNLALDEQESKYKKLQDNLQSLADTMQSSMSDAFMSMIEGTKSFKDAMKDMARAVIKQLLEVLVVQKLVGSFDNKTGIGSGIVGAIGKLGVFQADGGAWQGGSQIKAYANGGVVGGPTYFPMSGGKTGLMGEAGPEAIMPLKRGANGKLGVQMEGGGGDNVVINQSFNFQANGDDSVKKLIAQAAPKIAQMTKSSMLDDRRRGGQTKSVFG